MTAYFAFLQSFINGGEKKLVRGCAIYMKFNQNIEMEQFVKIEKKVPAFK